MPLWLELMLLTILAYAAGLALGWSIWARSTTSPGENNQGRDG